MSYKTVPDIDKISNKVCNLDEGCVIGDLTILGKLGTGAFATVYAAECDGKKCAVKIYNVGKRNARYYRNEIRMLGILKRYRIGSGTSTNEVRLVKYKDTFAYVSIGNDLRPYVYPCVKFKLMGDHLGRFLRKQMHDHGTGFAHSVVSAIMRQLFTALKFLHDRDIIHTDVKPENIFLEFEVGEVLNERVKITLGDLGTSTFSDDLFSHSVGTTQYMAPELMLDLNYTSAIDIWAAFTMCYELVTGALLFDVYGENSIKYESDNSYRTRSSSTHSEHSEEDYTETNYEHLMLMEKILGKPPKALTNQGRTYYNARGHLKNNPEIESTPLIYLLVEEYEIPTDYAEKFVEFLMLGLQYIPENRITAETALEADFLKD